tara:strand:+ start:33 stop:407 length:375 start_codon:yes stop_codon:yes gene_type:complete
MGAWTIALVLQIEDWKLWCRGNEMVALRSSAPLHTEGGRRCCTFASRKKFGNAEETKWSLCDPLHLCTPKGGARLLLLATRKKEPGAENRNIYKKQKSLRFSAPLTKKICCQIKKANTFRCLLH